ncbi:MAG: 3-hydroxyacyl-CoA dehydrogenase NAD-binding domain-containing protein, partial [Propionibacteriaceae bacterium]
KGKLTQEQAEALVGQITFTTDYADAHDCSLIVEAAFEDPTVKEQLFTALEQAAPHAILATNTSSLSVTDIAETVADPSRVIGIHFFNPAPVQKLVEVIVTKHTAPETQEVALELLATLGKTPIVIGDRAGFVVNALLITYLNDAINLYAQGFATREAMDEALVAAGNPMGPLTLADLIGNDVNLAIMDRMMSSGRALHQPATLLRELCEKKDLGRKTGRGFYAYDGSDYAGPIPTAPRARNDEVELRLLACYLGEAVRMVEDGYATPDQIDTGMALGCRMPKPFEQLAALTPAVVRDALVRFAAEPGAPDIAPCQLLHDLADGKTTV